MTPLDHFRRLLAGMDRPRVLEVGSRTADGGTPGSHRGLVLDANSGASYVGVDLAPGPGVDAVCDAHRLSTVFPAGHFDAFLSCSTFEHLARPWVVARELAIVSRLGAVGYVQTHQSFPLHDHPGDFFRFSKDALAEVFCAEMGWRVLGSGHAYPAIVVPEGNYFAHARGWNFAAPAFLNSDIVVEKAVEFDRALFRWGD